MEDPNQKEKEFYESLPLKRKALFKKAFCKHFLIANRTFYDRLTSKKSLSQAEKAFFNRFDQETLTAVGDADFFPKEAEQAKEKEGEVV